MESKILEDIAGKDNSEYENEDDELECDEEDQNSKQRRSKPGVIYMPTIPPYMTVAKLREILGEFGEIGRVFLQPDDKTKKRKKGPALNYSEGWVEFKSKRVAKNVAATLNNNQIDTRSRSKYCDLMWNIKYLSGFKWVHLSERLAYERAVHKQRLRAEVTQAKREASHFQANVERSEKIRRLQRKHKLEKVMAEQGYIVPQRPTAKEIQKKRPQDKTIERQNIVESLFGAKKNVSKQ